jgi:hypothetical protein
VPELDRRAVTTTVSPIRAIRSSPTVTIVWCASRPEAIQVIRSAFVMIPDGLTYTQSSV